MTWWLTCEHLVAATPLFSSDFVAFGLSFELGVTAPSSTDGWRGFCVRVVNRKGSGAFRVVMSYEVRRPVHHQYLILTLAVQPH